MLPNRDELFQKQTIKNSSLNRVKGINCKSWDQ